MNDIPAGRTAFGRGSRGSLTARWCRNALFGRLERLEVGAIDIVEDDCHHFFGTADAPAELRARVTVHDPTFYRDTALGGTVGAGESYVDGQWSCDSVAGLVRVLLRNRDILDNLEGGTARFTAPLRNLAYRLQRNTRRGSRRNIAAHYDLGNEFFKLFLDPTMTYSCGIFEDDHATMEQASLAKLERVCRKLQLGPDDHVLEIGSGWGSFALHAAARFGCRVTTTTISPAQYDVARARIAEAGLSDRVTVLLQDYRDVTGTYDKLVSIEMIEAVGHQYYPRFFRQCAARLHDAGIALIQAITIEDRVYDQARDAADFIKRCVFPGSCIPSITALSQASAPTGLRMVHLEDITPHYARTLRCWRERFRTGLAEVRALGYPETFIRLWDFYLSYCEGGFAEHYIGDVQMVYHMAGCRRPPSLPPLDASL